MNSGIHFYLNAAFFLLRKVRQVALLSCLLMASTIALLLIRDSRFNKTSRCRCCTPEDVAMCR